MVLSHAQSLSLLSHKSVSFADRFSVFKIGRAAGCSLRRPARLDSRCSSRFSLVLEENQAILDVEPARDPVHSWLRLTSRPPIIIGLERMKESQENEKPALGLV